MVSNIYSQDDSVFLSLMRNKYDLLIHHQSSFVLIASEALELLISLTVQQKNSFKFLREKAHFKCQISFI